MYIREKNNFFLLKTRDYYCLCDDRIITVGIINTNYRSEIYTHINNIKKTQVEWFQLIKKNDWALVFLRRKL